ncbi:MAG TPA: PadR family transcriptional regulator [Anaerolineales bacterium]
MKSNQQIDDIVPLREPTLLILLSLAAGDKHGYAIIKNVAALSNAKVILSTGTLYEALARLLEQGLIERVEPRQTEQAESHPGRPRKTYQLTAQGRRVIKAEISRMQALVATARQLLGEAGAR